MDFLEQLGEFACNDDPACRLENIGQCIQGFFNPVWRFIENKGRTGVSQGFQGVFFREGKIGLILFNVPGILWDEEGSNACLSLSGGLMSLSKALGAECIGTFWLVLGGCGSALFAAAFPELGIGFYGVALAFGLTNSGIRFERLCPIA